MAGAGGREEALGLDVAPPLGDVLGLHAGAGERDGALALALDDAGQVAALAGAHDLELEAEREGDDDVWADFLEGEFYSRLAHGFRAGRRASRRSRLWPYGPGAYALAGGCRVPVAWCWRSVLGARTGAGR